MAVVEKEKTPNRGIWKNLKTTYKYAKSGRKYLMLFMLANVLLTIISVVVPIIVAKRLIVLTSGFYQKLLGIIFLIFVIEIFRNIVRYFAN